MKIERLTVDQINTLQVDAALRLLGSYSNQIIDCNQLISQALIAKGKADIALMQLKNDKSCLVELCRNLKVLVNSG